MPVSHNTVFIGAGRRARRRSWRAIAARMAFVAGCMVHGPAAAEWGTISMEPESGDVARYGKLEITSEAGGAWQNPYDPDEIDMWAEFTGPSGRAVVVPAFYHQGFQRIGEADEAARPLLKEAGPPRWKVRFSPTEVGDYSFVLGAKVRGVARPESGQLRFRCVASDAAGFIRVSPLNRRYFQFDSGRPFFPVGQNLQNDWPTYRHSRLLAEGGANCARAWTFCHWTWLEWTPDRGSKWARPGDWILFYDGAGRYNQRIAWIADQCLDRWARDGIHVMFCLGNGTGGGELSKGGGRGSWTGHPYNVANGGFLDDPGQFWTDERARKLYKQKLRYIAARYGHSAAIWAWEFWNELGEATPSIAAWHCEMAEYLRGVDPNHHLITSSTWQWVPAHFGAVWDLGAIDFTQSHIYGALPEMADRVAAHLVRWHKPHVIGEGGGPAPNLAGVARGEDMDGIEFHNSLWAPIGLGAASTTLPWWWRERIEPRNLFPQYRAVANFVADMPWGAATIRPVRVRSIEMAGHGGRAPLSPVLIAPPGGGWGHKAARGRFSILPDGTMPGAEDFGRELYGTGAARKAWRNPPTIEATFPVPGQLILHVGDASHGILEVAVDGRTVLRETSLNGPKSNRDHDFAIDIPAGRHEIRLDNAGSDFIRIGHLILTNFRDASRYPDLDVLGVRSDDMAVLWLHDRLHQWPFKAAGLMPTEPLGKAVVRLEDFRDGAHRVIWWDTYKGAVMREDKADAVDGMLTLHVPPIVGDLACKIVREGR